MFIQAIVTDVKLPANEPFRERFIPLQRFLERPKPDEFLLRNFRPEFLRSFDGGVVNLFVLGERFDVRGLRKLLRRFETPIFMHHRSDVPRLVRSGRRGSGLSLFTHTEKSPSS